MLEAWLRMCGEGVATHGAGGEGAFLRVIEIAGMSCRIDVEILDPDAADGLLGIAIVIDGIGIGLGGVDVAEVEILVQGWMLAATVAEVIGLEAEDGAMSPLDLDIADMDATDVAATVAVGLEVEGVLDRADADVVHPDVLHTTRHL